MADFLSAFGRLFGGAGNKSTYQTTEAYEGLRKQILELTPEQLGAPADVLAVLMETGYPQAVATLVAIIDGSASLYFSTGGGIIGAGEKPEPNAAARNVVRKAVDLRTTCTPTAEFPLPREAHTRFYIITPNGVLTSEAKEEDLGSGSHQMSPLFHAAQELITQMRLADEKRKAD